MTDEQWAIIELLMWKSGNKSKWEKRELINAVLYLVDSRCKWRKLPYVFSKEKAGHDTKGGYTFEKALYRYPTIHGRSTALS